MDNIESIILGGGCFWCIEEIYNQLNKKNQLNLNDLGFLVGPILNSGGRLGKSSYSTELLTSDDTKKIKLR